MLRCVLFRYIQEATIHWIDYHRAEFLPRVILADESDIHIHMYTYMCIYMFIIHVSLDQFL